MYNCVGSTLLGYSVGGFLGSSIGDGTDGMSESLLVCHLEGKL